MPSGVASAGGATFRGRGSMTASVALPFGGLSGWTFLQRTRTAQEVIVTADPQTRRDEAYFREKIAGVATAEDLVADRRLLKVALGAFGLEADIGNRYFIRKVLEDGSGDDTDLANKLSDKSYLALTQAFGFDQADGAKTATDGFADTILSAYRSKSFQAAVGERSNALRLALNAEETLAGIASAFSSDNTKWYKILGSTPLRQVFTTAFNLPKAFSSQDLDQQLATLKQRARQLFKDDSVGQFADAETRATLIRRYIVLAGDDVSASTSGNGGAALAILQAGTESANATSTLLSALFKRA